MAANWWLALIIMVVLNGILVWTLFVEGYSASRRAKKWFFIVVNVIGLILAVSQFFWMDF
ncbi:hypothetical protein A3844_11125 [Paenibacillus helianthi]|uniref:Uncharacterized protein n=1 Tax=Paenibacillus helianthi TaxID=1349432 RepID=A0ABX3EP44_9BACL|nr:hypothetical protein A3848_29605 [Paenibacillus sp. P32E]OKP87042.1 hypothetical protein A3844_11125 [Paenibacillus helianthi]